MHSQRIIHRDLKAQNILIDQVVTLKLADLGQSKTLAENRGFSSTSCGTPGYQAPEILKSGEKHSYSVDIWSLGVLLYYISSG